MIPATTGPLTLLDLLRLRGANETVVDLVEEVRLVAPEMGRLTGRTIGGTTLRMPIRRNIPFGDFRIPNKGGTKVKSVYDMKETSLAFFDAQMEADEALVMADNPLPRVLAMEASGATRGAAIQVGSQFYYGVKNRPNGFPGLQSQVEPTMVVDAGGDGDNCTTVYAIIEGEGNVGLLYGNGGDFVMSDEWMRQRINDADGNPLFAWLNNLRGYIGLEVGYSRSVGIIKNINTSAGSEHGMTDALGYELLSLFPTGAKPTSFWMTNKALFQLQSSRSATNQQAYALGAVAALPTEISGVPIVPTDSIVNTETNY